MARRRRQIRRGTRALGALGNAPVEHLEMAREATTGANSLLIASQEAMSAGACRDAFKYGFKAVAYARSASDNAFQGPRNQGRDVRIAAARIDEEVDHFVFNQLILFCTKSGR